MKTHEPLINELNLYEELVAIDSGEHALAFKKQAAELPSNAIMSAVKNYFANQLDKDNPTKSIINILAPGVIKTLIGGPVGWIIGFALSAFGVDFDGLIRGVWDALKGEVSDDKPVTPATVDSAVDSSLHRLETQAQFQQDSNVKTAAPNFSRLLGRRSSQGSMLSKLLKFIFKVILSSVGLLVAGDVANKAMGRPNGLDGTKQQESGSSAPAAPQGPKSTQTKFKIKPGYTEVVEPKPWIEGVANNEASIENLLIDFAKDVYSGLDGLESKIKSSPAFDTVKNAIVWSNNKTTGDSVITIPKVFRSKKHIVDFFIDDVAKSV